MKKRKVEEVGAVEQMTEPPRSKSRLAKTDGGQNPDEMTVPGGTSMEMGAKSFCGREPTNGLGSGALGFGLIGKDQMKEERVSPGGIGQMDQRTHKYSC